MGGGTQPRSSLRSRRWRTRPEPAGTTALQGTKGPAKTDRSAAHLPDLFAPGRLPESSISPAVYASPTVTVLAVDDLRLAEMQLKAPRTESWGNVGQSLPRFSAVWRRVARRQPNVRIDIGYSRTIHPSNASSMNKLANTREIRDLRRVAFSLAPTAPYGICMGDFEPPLDVEQHPSLVSLVKNRFELQMMPNRANTRADTKSIRESNFHHRSPSPATASRAARPEPWS